MKVLELLAEMSEIEPRPTREPCVHHWVIETPNGATSKSYCKRCNTTRSFPNGMVIDQEFADRSGWTTRGRLREMATVDMPEQIELI